MSREPIPTQCYALVVVRLGHRFLVVQERKHGQRFYLPAGRVDPGERFADAARRETLEETGVPVVLEGIVRIEHTPNRDGSARQRVIYVGRPEGDVAPKSEPDDESLGARWVSIDELAALPLRGDDVRALFEHVAGGGAIYPLDLLTDEGARFPRR